MSLPYKKLLRISAGVSILGIFIVLYWQWLSYREFVESPLDIDQDLVIEVKPGQGINRLARDWQAQGYISNQYYLRLLARQHPELAGAKTGEYRLVPGETPLSLLQKIAAGQVIQYAVTIVEGTNIHQLTELLADNPMIDFDLPENPLNLQQKLGLDNQHPEGWFYPDTYFVARGEKASIVLKRAYQTMQRVLEQEWQNRALDLPYQSPYEALIMASIIEKETGIASERDMIAGVFVRRLNKNMRLQTDPTVIYGIGPDFNGDITYKDLRTATPYNTYVIKGLPPTPIAMPGQAAIHAALNPKPGKALYFVASGDGGHYFSETLEEHNRAVKRYLRKQRQD